MKLKKVSTLNEAEKRIYNATKGNDCTNFEIPFLDFTKNIFYIDFGSKEPAIVDVQLYDLVNNSAIATLSSSYVIGTNSNGFYGVFTGISNQSLNSLVLQFAVEYTDGTKEYFESEHFLYCTNVSTLESCYGAKVGLTDYYDVNGIYYGYPITTLFGDPLLKYTYATYVKDAVIVEDESKEFVNEIVNNRVANTTITYNGIFGNMIYPSAYASHIESILSRGQVKYNDKAIIVESFSSKKTCCGFDIFGKTKRTENLEYLCNCNESDGVICEPVAIGAIVLPDYVIGQPYYAEQPISGTAPFSIATTPAPIYPAWVTSVTIVGNNLVIQGSPDMVNTQGNNNIQLTLLNDCSSGFNFVYDIEQIDCDMTAQIFPITGQQYAISVSTNGHRKPVDCIVNVSIVFHDYNTNTNTGAGGGVITIPAGSTSSGGTFTSFGVIGANQTAIACISSNSCGCPITNNSLC